MKTLICSICLDAIKSPIALPCGHMNCDDCLKDYINTSEDAAQAVCPSCRANFNLVLPDLEYVPKKYHPYIHPAMRRVYLDYEDDSKGGSAFVVDAPSSAVERVRLIDLEARVRILEAEKANLTRQAEENAARHVQLQNLYAHDTARHANLLERERQATAELQRKLAFLHDRLKGKMPSSSAGTSSASGAGSVLSVTGPGTAPLMRPSGPPPTSVAYPTIHPASAGNAVYYAPVHLRIETHPPPQPLQSVYMPGNSLSPTNYLKRSRPDGEPDEGAARAGPGPSTAQSTFHAFRALEAVRAQHSAVAQQFQGVNLLVQTPVLPQASPPQQVHMPGQTLAHQHMAARDPRNSP